MCLLLSQYGGNSHSRVPLINKDVPAVMIPSMWDFRAIGKRNKTCVFCWIILEGIYIQQFLSSTMVFQRWWYLQCGIFVPLGSGTRHVSFAESIRREFTFKRSSHQQRCSSGDDSFNVGFPYHWKAKQGMCLLLNQYGGNLHSRVPLIYKDVPALMIHSMWDFCTIGKRNKTCVFCGVNMEEIHIQEFLSSTRMFQRWWYLRCGIFVPLGSGTRHVSFAELIWREFTFNSSSHQQWCSSGDDTFNVGFSYHWKAEQDMCLLLNQ